MRKLILFIFLLQFSHAVYSQQITGIYTPKKTFSIRNIFGKIPSYAFLQIKEDSTYYYESFWGSFENDKEYGRWVFFNDTILMIPFFRFSDTIKNHLDIQYHNNESVKDGTRIRIMNSGYGLKDIKIKVFKDNEFVVYYTDNEGYSLLKVDKSDYAIIELSNRYDCKDERILFRKEKNDLVVHLDVRYYIIKRNKLLNLENKFVGKKR